MANLLLDTHVLLYALDEPEALSPVARAALEAKTNALFISAVAAFEIATKLRIGKLPRAAHLLPVYPDATRRIGRELGVTTQHALAAGSLAWDHKDPFDRILAAQAMTEGMPLVTADRAFASLPGLATIW